jgi:hypothetical protein
MTRLSGMYVALAFIATDLTAQAIRLRSAVEEFRYGARPGDSVMTMPAVVAMRKDGGVVVVERSAQRFVQIDKQGRTIRTYGRRGRGPGETEGLAYTGTREDSIWMSDGYLKRITVFAPDGRVARTVNVRSGGLEGEGVLLADGTVALFPFISMPQYVFTLTIRRHSANGSAMKPVLSDFAYVQRTLELPTAKGGKAVGMQPWNDGSIAEYFRDGSGFVIVERAVNAQHPSFSVTRIAHDGSRLYRNIYSYNPVPIQRAHVDSQITFWSNQTGPKDPKARSRAEAALYKPAHFPTITQVVPMADGTVWLRREDIPAASQRWTVLDAKGRIAYDVDLPKHFYLSGGFGDTIWGAETNSDGIETLVRMKLR